MKYRINLVLALLCLILVKVVENDILSVVWAVLAITWFIGAFMDWGKE